MGKSRFNLILHGVLAIRVQDTDHLEILLPYDEKNADGKTDDACHQGYWGLPGSLLPIPQDGAQNNAQRFTVGFDGTFPNSFTMPHDDEYVCFDKAQLIRKKNSDSGGIRAQITVTNPDVVRGYRIGEISGFAQAVFVTGRQLPRIPLMAPQVIVLSWTNVQSPPVIRADEGGGSVYNIGGVPAAGVGGYDYFYNLCVYFHPLVAKQDTEHFGEIFGKMFENPNFSGLPTTVAPFTPDGPPQTCSPQSGLQPEFLLGLPELPLPNNAAPPHRRLPSGGTNVNLGMADGCAAAFVG